MEYNVWFIVANEFHWIGRAVDFASALALAGEYIAFPEYRRSEVRITPIGGAR
jgi:hypothetical protein